MKSCVLLFCLLFLFVIGTFCKAEKLETLANDSKVKSRQRRCIVVQKQSGTHGDSSEGSDGKPAKDPHGSTNGDSEESAENRKPWSLRRPKDKLRRDKKKNHPETDHKQMNPDVEDLSRLRRTKNQRKNLRKKYNKIPQEP